MNTQTKIEQLKAKQAAELAKLEKTEAIRAQLPEEIRDKAKVYFFAKDHATVIPWRKDFHYNAKNPTLADALKVVRLMQDHIVEGEHWKGACTSTYPAAINTEAKNEHAVMDGSHAVEIRVSGGRGFQTTEVRLWAMVGETLCNFHMEVVGLYSLLPSVKATYNRYGDLVNCTIDWPVESRCVDSFRKWWSEKPSYCGSYYLADVPNFESWASRMIAPELHKSEIAA